MLAILSPFAFCHSEPFVPCHPELLACCHSELVSESQCTAQGSPELDSGEESVVA